MRVGFTGTRHGMTEAQENKLRKLLKELEVSEFHHGDCQGADAQAHAVVRHLPKHIPIVGHPPTFGTLRAYLKCDALRIPQPFLARNRNIVDETDTLIATPFEDNEMVRSGTWSTVRYGRKHGKRVIVITREGELTK